ncbi:beta-1,3-glucanase family protein [Desulfovibrio gilichinskyi]|uniref:GH64 domain-containing protein n=1 Tax=Desulfovibrio gilichinskyi TaxID=1519643 RepID=A0A1X7CYI6_9BACT|nr:beta-1,3-glucanase family protein [Desulfovibrio gilichinskyi]SMF05457.1 hypothetical protein SAMN06295933_1436 [Desulfovibrio gilichinskyi]
MKTLCLALMLCLLLPASILAADIPIVFKLNAKHDPEKVYATFYNCVGAGPSPSITGTYNGPTSSGQALSTTRSYKMSELTSPSSIATGVPAGVPAVLVSDFNSGRIYISYDSPMGTFGCTQPSTEPTSNDPSLGIRFQPMELDIESGTVSTVTTPILNTNLTYIDYAAIALSLTIQNATAVNNNPLKTSVTSEVLTKTLGKTTIVQDATVRPSASDALPSTNFTRVLSPTSADMCRKYNDWTNYLKTTLYQSTTVNSKPIKIKGLFGGVGGQPANAAPLTAADRTARNQTQSYDYEVTFAANGDATMTAQTGSGNGAVAGVGTNIGVGVGDNTANVNITITFAALNASTGIYGNNPAYTYGSTTTTGVENDFYGWVVGDLLAGLSWGLPGSTVKFNATSALNVQIGDLTSAEWFGGLKASGGAYSVPNSPVGKGYIYSKAQPGNPTNYHTYAAGLKGITGAYGFGLQDRGGATLITFNRIDHPNGYLEIGVDTENHSTVGPSPSQQPGVVVNVNEFSSKDLTANDLKTTYAVENFTTYSTICSFNASINVSGGYGVFMMNSNTLPSGSPTSLRLLKLYSNGTSAFFGNYAATGPIYSDGTWWLTDLAGTHILPSDQLVTGNTYYVHFVVQDNGKYDENSALGQITDPVALGASTSSSSGCVLNPDSDVRYELAGMFIAALIFMVFRRKVAKRKFK